VNGVLGHLATVVDSADAAPTKQAIEATQEALAQLKSLLQQWQAQRKMLAH